MKGVKRLPRRFRKTFTGNCTSTLNHLASNDKFFDALLRGQGIHRVEQEFLRESSSVHEPLLFAQLLVGLQI
jgi:hypothetical protein